MAGKDSGEKSPLQQIVDCFVDIEILLELIVTDAKQLQRDLKFHRLCCDFDVETGRISSVCREENNAGEADVPFEIVPITETFIEVCEHSGNLIATNLEHLCEAMRDLESALAKPFHKKAMLLLDGLVGGNWHTRVIRHCLVPLNRWPTVQPRPWDSTHYIAQRRPLPRRLDALLRHIDRIDPTDYWQGICLQVDGYIDDVCAVAISMNEPIKIKAAKRTSRTPRGGVRPKLISALETHHEYDGGTCGNYDPAAIKELGKLAGVSTGAVTGFLNDEFGGHTEYSQHCTSGGKLNAKMESLCSPPLLRESYTRFEDRGQSSRRTAKPVSEHGDNST